MLRSLTADLSSFRCVRFKEGVNLLVAETTPNSRRTDSRNGTGKSSLIELLHFLLGASSAPRSLPRRPALKDVTFQLEMDWPLPGTVRVRRSGRDAARVLVEPDPREPGGAADGTLFAVGTEGVLSREEWNRLIEKDLFHLPENTAGVSGRTLLSFLIRRISAKAFNEPMRTFSQQPKAEATANLAYLLGLDWQLAGKFQELATRDNARKQLKKAAGDPTLSRVVGNTGELRGQIQLGEAEVERLRGEVREFRVVPAYEALKGRADELDRRIRAIPDEDVVDRRNVEELERSLHETTEPETDYLMGVYAEAGVALGDQVQRRFEDVRAFHRSIVRNRRHYLQGELDELRARLEERRRERAALGQELADVMLQLEQGGALESLGILQRTLAEAEAHLESLKHRYKAAQALESSARQIKAERAQLLETTATDLDERRGDMAEATLLFAEFARRLYGSEHEAYLDIKAGTNSLDIEPHIARDGSRGIGNMVIFCFDLALAVLAHRHGRGPDFLVHDSHLFDGVDDRQVAAALALAEEVTRRERIQYVATLNSDDLDKAVRRGYEPEGRIIEPRLADTTAADGLFGFRF